MKTVHAQQRGGSTVGLLIVLALIGAAVFFGMQYIPQYMQAGQVDSILESIEEANEATAMTPESVRVMIGKHLQVNGLQDLSDAFEVKKKDGKIIVTAKIDRELNLIYEKRANPYYRELVLFPR